MTERPTGAAMFLGWALLALVAAPASLLAQGRTLGPGARVRITISSVLTAPDLVAMAGIEGNPNRLDDHTDILAVRTREGRVILLPAPGARFAGAVAAVDDRLLLLDADHLLTPLTVPRGAIATLERATGRRSRARYAGFGALLGLGAGGVAGLVSSLSCKPSDWFCSAGFNAAALGTLGAGAGAVTGAILSPAERWSNVDVASLSSVPEAPTLAPSTPARPPRLTLAFQFGHSSSGPAQRVERAMRASGFDDASAGFGDPVAHPFSRTGIGDIGFPVLFEASYRIRPAWSLGVLAARTPIGETLGYAASGSQYLSVEYAVTTAGAVVTRHYRNFRVGAGPAVHIARARRGGPTTIGAQGPWSSDSQPGLVALGGVRVPANTRVYLDLGVQYRYLKPVAIGAFTPLAFGRPAATLPAFDAPFSHWLVAFGPGVRF